jgi:hypothetical protein
MIPNRPEALILFTIFFVGVLSSCFADETGRLSGKVVDAYSGRGLPEVLVTVEAGLEVYTASSDSSGQFDFPTLPVGLNFPIGAVKKGFKSVSTTVSIESGKTCRIKLTLLSRWLKLLYPQGGEHLIAGTDVVIRWEAYGTEQIRLELSINSGRHWYAIKESKAGERQCIWSVPDIPSMNCMIRIIGKERPGMIDQNEAPFSISSF